MITMDNARGERHVQLREYRSAWEYWRDLQQHVLEGWAIESTITRSPARDWLHYVSLGLAARLRGPERLVTYVRDAATGSAPQVATAAAATPALLPGLPMPSPVPALASVARAASKAIGIPVAGVDVVTGG